VIEGGANIGAHTVALSKLAGPTGAVLAFEPQRVVFQTLCANLALNSCANVRTFQCGIGAVSGQIDVPFAPPDQACDFGGVSLLGAEGGEKVPLVRIDDLELAACDVFKLDVEGMEVEALEGAAQTVRSFRPLMYVENDRQARAQALVGLLLDWDYRVYWHVTPLFSPDNFAGENENIFGNICSFNLLCVPRERYISVTQMVEITSETSPLALRPQG